MKDIDKNTEVTQSLKTAAINENEYKKMQEFKSNTVKLSGGNGIGIKVECLVKDKWVDITDYNSW